MTEGSDPPRPVRRRRRRPALNTKRVAQAVIGLAIGLALGLVYTWVISPVHYVDTAPSSLRADYQAAYVELVARAYAVDGDLTRARARLALLGSGEPAARVNALAQHGTTTGGSNTAQTLAALAAALSGTPIAGSATVTATASSPVVAGTQRATDTPALSETAAPDNTVMPSPTVAPSDTPSPSPTPTSTPLPTDTVVPSFTPRLLPTRTPTATPLLAFRLLSQQAVCDGRLDQPLIQVITEGSDGKQIPGVEVVVTWDVGFDHFFTGLKPDLGQGYGDFTMTPGTVYSVHLAESPSVTIDGLTPGTCTGPTGSQYSGSWLLVFKQP